MLDDYSHLKAGLYIANPATGATKAISTSADWENLFGFAANGNASVSTIAATVAWVYSAIEERRKTLGQIEYNWELNGEPIEDNQLPFEFKTLNYAMRADKAIQLVGNAYLWKWRKEPSRKIHNLRWLDPRVVEPDQNSVVNGVGYTNYKYNEQVGVYSKQNNIPADDIVRTFVEGLNELDPDSAAADAYNLAAQIIWGMEKTTDSFYDTNGLPIMLVKVSPGSKRQRDDTQSAFKRIFQKRRDGAGNKVVAVSNDVEIVPLSFAPKDLAQAELSVREIRSIYAVMSIPLEFLETRGDTRAVHATRTLVLTMAARFQLLADALNEDADIKKAGLFLRILPENHPAMKIDMGLAFDAVMKGVSSGMSLEAALFFNGVDVDSLPDGVSLVNEQPEPETAVVEAMTDVEPEPEPESADTIARNAEIKALHNFVAKGTHKKRPFVSSILGEDEIKAVIKAIAPEQRPFDSELMAIEERGTAAIARQLAKQRRCLLDGLTEENLYNIMNRPQCADGLDAAIMSFVTDAALFGSDKGRETIEREVFGVKPTTKAAGDFVAIDWELANTDATEWAAEYVGQLVTGINRTTMDRVRREVAAFTQSKETLPALVRRLSSPTGIFSPKRAEMIAVTETTRAYAEGNTAAWRASKVVTGRQWQTVRDELVCPICSPLNEEIVSIDGDFQDGLSNPPAHPNCRCFLVPVIIEPDDGMTAEDRAIIAEMEADTAAFDASSPLFGLIPEGRAPRGLGAEYADRRRAFKRIKQMENNLGKLQRTSSEYRGQRNRRYAETVRQGRITQLRDGLETIYKLMEGEGEWDFKAEMANGIADYITAMNGAFLR